MKRLALMSTILMVCFWSLPIEQSYAQGEAERLEREIKETERQIVICQAELERVQTFISDRTTSLKVLNSRMEKLYACLNAAQTRLRLLRGRLLRLPPEPTVRTPAEPKASPTPDEVEAKKKKLLDELIETLEKRLAKLDEDAKRAREDLDKIRQNEDARQRGLNSESSTAGGVSTTTFTTPQGRLIVYLPGDMATGDTISGTVVPEPNGQTAEERARNLTALNQYQLKIANETIRSPWGQFNWRWLNSETGGSQSPVALETLEISLLGVGEETEAEISLTPSPATNTGEFRLPSVGQDGRPNKITGPFDGDHRTSQVTIGGQAVPILAESPRTCFFRSPGQSFGTAELVVREKGVEAKGPYRNIGVSLAAPKTNLLKGEQTTVTITVSGLKGLQQNVPLLLEKKGDVSMEGGDVQTVQIKPSDVVIEGVDPNVNVRRLIIGLRPGFFNITATVIDPRVRPLVIPLIENGGVNGFRVKKDGTGFVLNIENVKHPITGDPVDGEHKLAGQCPNLGKLPFVKKLFLNKGYGRTESDCLIMVTPRIIINEEDN
jgi:hypothetical protein